MFRCTYTSLLLGASVVAMMVPAAAASDEPAPHLTAKNGASECWGRGHTSTLWHFVVSNDGTATGRYTVSYRWTPDGQMHSYTRRVQKARGVNDGIVIPAGCSIDYVTITTPSDGRIFLRYGVRGSPSCG